MQRSTGNSDLSLWD